jgi:hypothetical protein
MSLLFGQQFFGPLFPVRPDAETDRYWYLEPGQGLVRAARQG